MVHFAPGAQCTRQRPPAGQASEQSPSQVNSQIPVGLQLPTALGPTLALQPPGPEQSTVQSAPQLRSHCASPSQARRQAPLQVASQLDPSVQVQAAAASSQLQLPVQE